MEQQNKTIEQYLQALSNYEQDNRVQLLPLAECAYHNSVHHSTRMTPFWANYHYHLPMEIIPPIAPPNMRLEILMDATVSGMEETLRRLWPNWLEYQIRQSKYAGDKDVTLDVGNKVWLSTRDFRPTRPSKKLEYKRTGQYTVSTIINKYAYTLDLAKIMRNQNVFHVSQLDYSKPPVVGQLSSEPNLVIVDDLEDQEVKQIFDYEQRYRKLHNIIQRTWYTHIRTSWAPFDLLENASGQIVISPRNHWSQPRRWRQSDHGSGGFDGNGIWRFRSIRHFLFYSLFRPSPVQMASTWALPPPNVQWIGGGVSPSAGRSPWLYRPVVELIGSYQSVWALDPVFCLYLAARKFCPKWRGYCKSIVMNAWLWLPGGHGRCPASGIRQSYMDFATEAWL